MRLPVVLCDIDNCIADDEWRIPRINWQKHGDERYHDYHLLSGFDRPVLAKSAAVARKAIFRDKEHPFGSTTRLFFLTARPNAYRALTEHWLKSVGPFDNFELLMRPDGHAGKSAEIKQMQLEWLLEPIMSYDVRKEDICIAMDDHPEVIAMYQRNGIPAELVSIHSTSAYHDPIRNIAAA